MKPWPEKARDFNKIYPLKLYPQAYAKLKNIDSDNLHAVFFYCM